MPRKKTHSALLEALAKRGGADLESVFKEGTRSAHLEFIKLLVAETKMESVVNTYTLKNRQWWIEYADGYTSKNNRTVFFCGLGSKNKAQGYYQAVGARKAYFVLCGVCFVLELYSADHMTFKKHPGGFGNIE